MDILVLYDRIMKKAKQQVFANVWDAIAESPQEAVNLKLRSELMDQIEALIRKNGWTQAEAARRCGVSQPRINDLLRGRISRFSLDALVNMLTDAGLEVDFRIKAPTRRLA